MENGKTLKEFIKDAYPKEYIQLVDPNLPASFQEFLNSVKVFPVLHENFNILPKFTSVHYPEFIDSLILHLIQTKLENVLASGYVNPTSSVWSSYHVNPSSNFQVNQIKNQKWNRLHNILTRDNFVYLLTSFVGYLPIESNNYLQIFGPPPKFQKREPCFDIFITNSKLLYRHKFKQGLKQLIYEDGISELLELNPNSSFKRIVLKWQQNDRKCRYQYIYMNLIRSSFELQKSVLSNSTKASDVVKFVLIICGKIFPLQTWGSKKNKSMFFSAVAHFINGKAHSRHSLKDLFCGFKIQDLSWSNDSEITFRVLNWIFKNVIQKVIQSFWYVTDLTTNDSGIHFFPHDLWNSLTKVWFQQYMGRYLKKTESTDLNCETYKFNYGTLRFIPKVDGFRLILIPAKVPYNRKEDTFTRIHEIEYIKYVKDNIDPIRLILTNRCSSISAEFPLNSTIQDVISKIHSFKKEIEQKYQGIIPKYHIIKFDMKESYDRINQRKLFAGIECLFSNVKDNFTYSIRNFVVSSVHDRLSKKNHLEIIEGHKSVAIDDMEVGNNRVIIDKGKCLKFTKKQILEICKEQIFNTSAILFGSPVEYKRKIGIFQGCLLLPTFCNIAYTIMMNEQFKFLVNLETLCLRVADDFLIISTNHCIHKEVRELVNSPMLHKYGAFVNKSKTFLPSNESDNVFTFLGLKIDAISLDIYKDYNNGLHLPSYCLDSYKSMFKFLLTFFISRLERSLIDLKSSSFYCVLQNVLGNLKSILNTFILHHKKTQKKLDLDPELLHLFLSDLLSTLHTSFIHANGSDREFYRIKDEALSAIISSFRNHTLLSQIIAWLDSQ